MLGAVGSLVALCTALHLEPGVGTNSEMCRWTGYGYTLGMVFALPVLNRVYNFAPVCPKRATAQVCRKQFTCPLFEKG